MPDCASFVCTSTCAGFWAGCYIYSCINVAPVTAVGSQVTILGTCSHVVTRINEYNGSWSDYGGTLRNYYEATTVPADKGQLIYSQHVKDLRDAINEERYRRRFSGSPTWASLTKKTWTVDIVTGTPTVISDAIDEMRDAINEIQAGSSSVDPNTGNIVKENPDIDSLRIKIEQFRKSCVCDTDCGSNAVCACYCDCGCNYSDERLKRDIRSL